MKPVRRLKAYPTTRPNPNGGSLPAWPKYDAAKRGYLELTNAGPVVKSDLRRPFCEIFSEKLGLKAQ